MLLRYKNPFLSLLIRSVPQNPFVTILATVLITALVSVLLLNLTTSEKKIQKRIHSLCSVCDAQFIVIDEYAARPADHRWNP